MGRSVVWGAVAAAMLALPTAVTAQAKSLQTVQAEDVTNLRDKYGGLAEAIPEFLWDWRPMEGVRSVRDVVALAVAEANLFPGLWGAQPPAGVQQGFQAEMERLTALPREELIAQIEPAFEFMRGTIADMDGRARMADGSFFGQPMSTEAVIDQALGDMHEHLGQLIAYARHHRVVPPWSR